ncbi:DNA-(apurinic or apyrimidinic site) lyase 2-like [Actinia tenebrosa]|uniref:DNA-(apurinic or apyrimidinic site) endonuclease n=1 Tax=Actinia tenebrosa TaxID=6105 RepID=A0A6P8I860_ACTTE|nr:DNA-(apurinic or apyrimidinic site) lyase 2-like [Actinia tenebrosa]
MTFNINGIRAVTRGKSLKEFLDSLEADIMCFQETKITRDMLEESICMVEGYNAYFSFSRVKTGYSGVATFCKDKTMPCAAEEGLTAMWTQEPSIGCYGTTDCFTSDQLSTLDREGRAVLTEHTLDNGDKVVIVNVYCPRAETENEERMEFKMRYYKLLQIRVEALVASGRHVIVLGDMNLAHKPIDHCNPGDPEKFNAYPSRIWMSQFIKDITVKNVARTGTTLPKLQTAGLYSPYFKRTENVDPDKQALEGRILVDSFRYIYPARKDAFTNWCTSTGARLTNYGNRLDYIVADLSLVKQRFVDVIIRPEVEGSDHCPVVAFLSGRIMPSKRPPPLCSRFMPEFAGKQQKLASYFMKKVVETSNDATETDSEAESSSQEATPKDDVKPELKKGSSLKRTGSFEAASQAKRPKTSQSVKKKSIFQFFGKKEDVKISAEVNSSSCVEEKEEKSEDSEGISNSDLGKESKPDKVNIMDQSDSQKQNSEVSTDSTAPFENGADSQSSTESIDSNKKTDVAAWKSILKGPPPAPLCLGHNEPCVLRTVKKKGPNYGRQFHCCARPEGHYSNKEARCKFFKWIR